MDRPMVYPGAIPLETDLLRLGRYGMVGLGALAAALFGSTTTANGLAVTPTSPASMSVQVAAGQIYASQNVDDAAFSSLPAETIHQIVKQGINLDPVALSCPAPTTAGYSVNYLIQAAFQETDTDPVVLPFYNASNPAAAYSGPANSGSAQPTRRRGAVVLTAKPGVAATTGSQTTPAADAGYIGLCVVTVPYGATAIGPSNISPISSAPVVPSGGILAALQAVAYASRAETAAGSSTAKGVTPDGLAQAVQGGSFLYCIGSNSPTTITAALAPAPAGLTQGMEVAVKFLMTNTGAATFNINALGAKPITYNGNALPAGLIKGGQIYVLIYDGGAWQLQSPSFHGIVAYQQGSTGYRVYSNGDIDQWGNGACGSDGSFTVTFPIAFPTSCERADAVNQASGPPTGNPGCQILSASQMRVWSASSAGQANGAGTASFWEARGH